MSNACIDIAMIMLCWLVLRPKRCFLFVRMNGKVQKLVVKANSCIAPIGTETKNGNKKHRKRKRSKRKKD